MTVATVSRFLTPDTSYEDIQKHVENLIRENERLKGWYNCFFFDLCLTVSFLDTIAQNNLSMKNQFIKIQAWKEEVTNICKENKATVNQARIALKQVGIFLVKILLKKNFL